MQDYQISIYDEHKAITKDLNQLTYSQLTTVVSRFQTSRVRLKQSGDYPEEESDKEILNILIDMKYTAKKEEGR